MNNPWLFQKNIWQEYGYDRLIESVKNEQVPYEEVHIIPFTEEFDKTIDFVPQYIFGSNRFITVCRKKQYPTFPSFSPIEDFYEKSLWLNQFGIDCSLAELRNHSDYPVFAKPYTEKFFTGRILECKDDIEKIQLSTSFIEDEEKEQIRVSPVYSIKIEVRLFIIGGQIISGSVYKTNGIAKYQKIDNLHPSWTFGEQVLLSGSIADGFALDVGLVDGMWKIIELNNLNSSGLYNSDTDAIVRALKQL